MGREILDQLSSGSVSPGGLSALKCAIVPSDERPCVPLIRMRRVRR